MYISYENELALYSAEGPLEQSITFQQAKEHMEKIYHYCQKNKEMTFDVGNSIKITSPGKKGVGDYRVEVDKKTPTHIDICHDLFSYIRAKEMSCDEMSDMLEDIYEKGLNIVEDDRELVIKLKKIIFWISLQEDINYPISDGYLGRKHPLFRYAEALIVAQREGNDELLGPVYNNANSKSPKTIQLFDTAGITAPKYYNSVEYRRR